MTAPSFLIIEPNDHIARLLSNSLFRLDHNGLQVKRVQSLVEVAQALAQESYDLVFTSLTLPDCTDLNILHEIQQVTDAPIIVIGDINSEDEREVLLRHGAGDVLNPLESDKDEILSMVRSVIGRNTILKEKQKRISDLIDANITHVLMVEEMRSVNDKLAHEITRRKDAEQKNTLLVTAIEHLTEGLVITDLTGHILYINPAFEKSSGYIGEDLVGVNVKTLNERIMDPRILQEMDQTLRRGKNWRGKVTSRRRDDSLKEEEISLSLVKDGTGTPSYIVAVTRDIAKESALERQLMQAQKLESIGQLAAGIAHEINTPTQYVGDNIRFFRDAFADIAALLDKQRKIDEKIASIAEMAESIAAVEAFIEKIDLEYYREEVPLALSQALEGIERISEIVMAMKEFSHPGTGSKQPADLNRAIQNTVTVCRNEWKYAAEMSLDLSADLPPLLCHIGELNQVVLNLIVNAAHAILPKHAATGLKGKIIISTKADDAAVEIRVADTGIGIPEDIRKKIFDPFFTTKEVGKGTGQGLAIAYSTVVDKHNGMIDLESTVGEGTVFIIRLPLS